MLKKRKGRKRKIKNVYLIVKGVSDLNIDKVFLIMWD